MNQYQCFGMLMSYYETEKAIIPLEDLEKGASSTELVQGLYLFIHYLNGKYTSVNIDSSSYVEE
ncbi:hypothetical protein HNR44_001816 [Geomicrobium halophilum]|uniref:Uncharacterized protein n=1 Tax=Geomicrobium halophilum TaxID=549000 RepID=A0A841Q1M2_9BACL|nr:hypothetical protein [Geomicrobium halophilum]MBB6449838.1 hypothetical protein [Geomicrobium halophilum]